MGVPTSQHWPGVVHTPEYNQLKQRRNFPNSLKQFIILNALTAITDLGLQLTEQMFDFDPEKRITAMNALEHGYFKESPQPGKNSFRTPNGEVFTYPKRKIIYEDNDIMASAPTGTRKRKQPSQ